MWVNLSRRRQIYLFFFKKIDTLIDMRNERHRIIYIDLAITQRVCVSFGMGNSVKRISGKRIFKPLARILESGFATWQ